MTTKAKKNSPGVPKELAAFREKLASRKQRHVIVATWSDSPPELLAVFEGTAAEAQAFCEGWTQASQSKRDSDFHGGMAQLLDDAMQDEHTLPVIEV